MKTIKLLCIFTGLVATFANPCMAQNAKNTPLVEDRIVFNWHNFLSGCSTWNFEDWSSWTEKSREMGYNAIMVHAYGNNPMAAFTFEGMEKPVGYLSSTARGRDWNTMHVNDVRHLIGGVQRPRVWLGGGHRARRTTGESGKVADEPGVC